MRFQRRPVEVHARQWNGLTHDAPSMVAWILAQGGSAEVSGQGEHCALALTTTSGGVPDFYRTMVPPGAWIVKEDGRYAVYGADAFTSRYGPL